MVKIRVEGLKELDRALGQLKPSTGKNVLRRVARKALQPIIDDAKTKVHVQSGDTRDSLAVSTRLSRSQAAIHKKLVRGDRSSVEMFAGVGAHLFVPQGVWEEFGFTRRGKRHGPHPFLRPAWDSGKMKVLTDIKQDLWAEIRKAANRAARKKLKAGGK